MSAGTGKGPHSTGAGSGLFESPGLFDPVVVLNQSPLLKLLYDDILAHSPRPQPVYALAAALPTLAHLVCHRFRLAEFDHLKCNVYCIAVGDPSTGKNGPIKRVQKVIRELGSDYIDRAASWQGVEDRMFKYGPEQFIASDEGADHFENFKGQGEASNNSLLSLLLKLYDAGSLTRRVKADDAKDRTSARTAKVLRRLGDLLLASKVPIPADLVEVINKAKLPSEERYLDDPQLSVFIATTPESMTTHMTARNVHNGLLNRFLYVGADEAPTPQTVNPSKAPADLAKAMAFVAGLTPAQCRIKAAPPVVQFYLRQKVDELIEAWAKPKLDPKLASELMSRVQQNALKVAAILAATRFVDAEMRKPKGAGKAGKGAAGTAGGAANGGAHAEDRSEADSREDAAGGAGSGSSSGSGGASAIGPQLTEQDFAAAFKFAWWCGRRIAPQLLMGVGTDDERSNVTKVRKHLRGMRDKDLKNKVPAAEAGWRSRTTILQSLGLQSRQLKEVLNTLVMDAGEIEVRALKTGKPGRMPEEYRVKG